MAHERPRLAGKRGTGGVRVDAEVMVDKGDVQRLEWLAVGSVGASRQLGRRALVANAKRPLARSLAQAAS